MIESAVLGVRYGDRATNLPVAAVAARCQCRSIDLRQSFIFQFEKFLYSLTGTFLEGTGPLFCTVQPVTFNKEGLAKPTGLCVVEPFE